MVDTLEAAGVLSAEEDVADSNTEDSVVPEPETAEEPAETQEEVREVSETVETLDDAGPNEEAREKMAAADEVAPVDADAPVVRIKIERGAEIRAARDAVLDIDIDSIDFEFEDE